MSIDVAKYQQLKQADQAARDEMNRVEGSLRNQMLQLKTNHGLDTVEQADQRLQQLEQEELRLSQAVATELAAYETAFNASFTNATASKP